MFKPNTLCEAIDNTDATSIAINGARSITLWSDVSTMFGFHDFSAPDAPAPLILQPNQPMTLGPPPVGAFDSLSLYVQTVSDAGNINVVWW